MRLPNFNPAPSPLSPDLMRVTHARPLNPAELAFVPFEVVLIRLLVLALLRLPHTCPFSPDLMRVTHAGPLTPEALAFVPFGMVLPTKVFRVRVRVELIAHFMLVKTLALENTNSNSN